MTTTEPGQATTVLDNRAPEQVHSGQVKMAYRLLEQCRSQLRHVHGVGWLYWDGTRWTPDDLGISTRAVLAVLRAALAESFDDKALRRDIQRCESANGVAGVLRIAAHLRGFATTPADLDADPWQLNVANGTLDLRTGELLPHHPANLITKVARAAHDPDATGTTWEAFLARVLPDEQVRAYLQRIAGVALLGEVREHLLPILTGTGANGKSVWYEAMLFALGDYAATAEPDLFMARDNVHTTGMADLMGRRLVVVSESDRGRRLAEATMKRLTGGDRIKARKMRQDFIEFAPSHLAMLITNHLPKVSGDDPAVWRRLRVVPFDVVIPPGERDPGLGAALQAEADAVLTWAAAGLAGYQASGLNEPATVLEATDQYQRDSDAVARFVAEMCLTGSPVNKAMTEPLHGAFERWRTGDGAEPMSFKAFGQALDRMGYPARKGAGGRRFRQGIALRSDLDE